jgi:RimJ/RimL family protein N-acetyltransferase
MRAHQTPGLRVSLREVTRADLPRLYEIQCDPQGNDMAGVNPRGHDEFFSIWEQHLANPEIIARVILADDQLVGSLSRFPREDRAMIGYWIDRPHWGRGIATQALRQLITIVTERPLHASVAEHNAASLRVLQKCGFREVGRQFEPATARFRPCVEVKFILDAPLA